MSKIDHSLFHADKHALQQAFGECPKCASELQLKHSKNGPFIGCGSYPKCDFSKPLHEHEDSLIKVIDGSCCPECSAVLAVKKGRYGLFIGCSRFPECHHIESIREGEEQTIACPNCDTGRLVTRANKYGKAFYACTEYPRCKFILNHKPVEGTCEKCGFSLLQQRGNRLQCANKLCQHTQPD